MFIVILFTLLIILAFSFLINIWETSAKSGFAQVVFLLGVVAGMVAELAIVKIETRVSAAGIKEAEPEQLH